MQRSRHLSPTRQALRALTAFAPSAAAALLSVAGIACSKAPAASAIGGRIGIVVDDSGFNPGQITVAKGVPLSLDFKRISDKTCATKVVFPELNVEHELPLNKTVSVEIPTDKARIVSFQCGMGMYKSSVVVN
jgi:P-type Cu+ transporter